MFSRLQWISVWSNGSITLINWLTVHHWFKLCCWDTICELMNVQQNSSQADKCISTVVSLFSCSVVSLFHCLVVSLFRYFVVPLFHCSVVSMFRCSIVSLFRCFVVPLFRCSIVSLFRYFEDLLSALWEINSEQISKSWARTYQEDIWICLFDNQAASFWWIYTFSAEHSTCNSNLYHSSVDWLSW